MVKECKYFPCHEKMDDCMFCHCPLYPCENEKRGKFVGDKPVWDCSDCNHVHQKKVAKRLFRFISRQSS
jgi:Zn-finger protein